MSVLTTTDVEDIPPLHLEGRNSTLFQPRRKDFDWLSDGMRRKFQPISSRLIRRPYLVAVASRLVLIGWLLDEFIVDWFIEIVFTSVICDHIESIYPQVF